MKKVMVFPCGSEIGLEIHRALEHFTEVQLVGASSTDDHGRFVYRNYISGVPHYADIDFLDQMVEIASNLKIDFIYPAHDGALLELAENRSRFEHTEIITSPVATCQVCRSKRKTYDTLKAPIKVPRVYNRSDTFLFPVFLKPAVGQGSKGTFLATGQEDVDFYLQKDPTLMVLEYLPGDEYTVDCFTDNSGRLLVASPRKRQRIMNGISVKSQLVADERLTAVAKEINSQLQLRGAWFFQAKENSKGEPVLLEVAPRPASSMGILRLHGTNIIRMTLEEKLGLQPILINHHLEGDVDRALDTNCRWKGPDFHKIYLRVENTLVANNRPHPQVMQLIYNARNRDHEIVLVSRQETDFPRRLDELQVYEGLFHEMKYLDSIDQLVRLVDEPGSIYVDNHASTRSVVASSTSVPVFDLDAIDTLYT